MTERFEVPEPTEQAFDDAYGAHHNALEGGRGKSFAWHLALKAAMEVDVPRIVRQEVERALDAAGKQFEAMLAEYVEDDDHGITFNGSWRRDYLAARFGEAAPETPSEPCGKLGCTDPRCAPTPSAPAETRIVGGVVLPPECSAERCAPLSHITPAERAFLRALAEERVVGAEGPQGLVYDPLWAARRARADDEATAAARKFLAP